MNYSVNVCLVPIKNKKNTTADMLKTVITTCKEEVV